MLNHQHIACCDPRPTTCTFGARDGISSSQYMAMEYSDFGEGSGLPLANKWNTVKEIGHETESDQTVQGRDGKGKNLEFGTHFFIFAVCRKTHKVSFQQTTKRQVIDVNVQTHIPNTKIKYFVFVLLLQVLRKTHSAPNNLVQLIAYKLLLKHAFNE